MNPSIRTILATAALVLAATSAQGQTRYTYTASGGEVNDTKTGLTWRRCSEGQIWSGSTCTGTPADYTHEQALAQAKAQAGTAGWRLPNVKELASIANKAFARPAIDSTAFPGTPSEYYWSSTPYPFNFGSLYFAYAVDFTDGGVYPFGRDNSLTLVRLVR